MNRFSSDGTKKVPYKQIRPSSVRTVNDAPSAQMSRFVAASPVPYPEMAIAPHGQAIVNTINDNIIVALNSPTGTGKTRYIPYLLASRGYRVRVAIPTTVAVRDAYNFQRKYSRLRVGFAAGREVHYSDDDQLVYATTGHFTQRMLSAIKEGRRQDVRAILGDIVFIDEVHTATSQITLLIGLLRQLYTIDPVGSYGGPRLVFSTATFNPTDITNHFPEFPTYKVTLKSHPVQDVYLDQPRDPLKDDPLPEIVRIIRSELDRWIGDGGPPHHGIIFRPGMNEVEDTIEELENRFGQDEPIDFYPAYSHLSPSEIDRIFHQSDRMKVVVGTNVVESSITIDDVGFVVDDLLEKMAETSTTGGHKLTLSLISKAASDQRRGRTGRTRPGRNYRLVSAQQFEELTPFRLREIDRVPIFDIVLQLIDAKLDPQKVLRISPQRYQQAQNILKTLGMVVDDQVTPVGRFVSSVPLSVQNAYMVYLGYQRYEQQMLSGSDLTSEKIILRTIIAVACAIEAWGPSYFHVPRRERGETVSEYIARKDAHIEKYHEHFRGQTDIHTLVNIFWQMMIDIDVARRYDTATSHPITNYIREWSINNSMNNKKLREFFVVMRDVESLMESSIRQELNLRTVSPTTGYTEVLPRGRFGEYGYSLGRDLPDGGFDHLGNLAAEVFKLAYANNTFTLIRDDKGKVFYLDPKTGIRYKINRNSSFSQINESNPPLSIVAAQTVEVQGQGGGRFWLLSLIADLS